MLTQAYLDFVEHNGFAEPVRQLVEERDLLWRCQPPRYLSCLTLWRAPIGWYILLLIGLPAVSYLGAFLGGTLTREALAQPPLPELLALMGFMLILGPILHRRDEAQGHDQPQVEMMSKRLFLKTSREHGT